MGKAIAVHSYKGGTGKTMISINLAVTLARRGNKVCLLDLDFRAPSIATLLKAENVDHWMNDYLNGTCEIDEVLVDASAKIKNEGKFFVGFANPATEAIRDIVAKDRKWEMRALGRLLALRNSLLNDGSFKYLIFDTSPGLQFSSINAIVTADLVIVPTTFDESDVEGTKRMLKELYELFEKKTEVLLNKVLSDAALKGGKELMSKIEDVYQTPVLGIIPCFCDVLKGSGRIIFVHEKPDHLFTKIMSNIADKIENSA